MLTNMRNLALADLTQDDLRAMLAENETLFVEHKSGIGGEGFQISKAICSFANTLGGWVLIGITDSEPNEGAERGWEPVAPHELTDRVRQVLTTNRVDPVPAFAATVIEYEPSRQKIGVVRIYESGDTPHVMGNGQVFVRSIAEDRDVYRAVGIDSQSGLVALTRRGADGVTNAMRKFDPEFAPFAASQVGLPSHAFGVNDRSIIGLRAVPVTGSRLADWSVSVDAAHALEKTVRKLARIGGDLPIQPLKPHASGLSISAQCEDFVDDAENPKDGIATVGTDAAGVVVASIRMAVWQPARPKTTLTLNGFQNKFIDPLLDAVVSILLEAELNGRTLLNFGVGGLNDVLALDEGNPANVPRLPIAGELTLPISDERSELELMSNRWREDLGRAAGYLTLRA